MFVKLHSQIAPHFVKHSLKQKQRNNKQTSQAKEVLISHIDDMVLFNREFPSTVLRRVFYTSIIHCRAYTEFSIVNGKEELVSVMELAKRAS